MRKFNEENERIKRRYLQYLKVAQRKDTSTVVKAAEGILRFEASTNFTNFKTFRIEQPIKFQDTLNSVISKTTGKPLSKSTIRGILCANKGFFFWLADQAGYKSRIRYSDADYFNMDAKGARIASAVRETPYPSMEMARHAFSYMPETKEIERRNKALFAFFMLTGARDGAVASLRYHSQEVYGWRPKGFDEIEKPMQFDDIEFRYFDYQADPMNFVRNRLSELNNQRSRILRPLMGLE